jgi:hypothetical protein
VREAEQRLAVARAAQRDQQSESEEQHELRAYEGQEWLAARRGAFGSPLDTSAVAEALRARHAEMAQSPEPPVSSRETG